MDPVHWWLAYEITRNDENLEKGKEWRGKEEVFKNLKSCYVALSD